MIRWALRVLAGALGIALAVYVAPAPVHSPSGRPVAAPSSSTPTPSPPPAPLAGLVLALDPGHQLGNHDFPEQINRLVPAGGFRKACNTTGTESAAGVPEATVTWRITRLVQARLQDLGATVRLTRSGNSEHRWGPCVDARGRFGARVGARLMVSVHADGAPPADHGFHVIARPGQARSLRLARALRAGFDEHGLARSSYVGGGSALSLRSDLATLNLSTVPVAMLEIGNMANPADAHRMTSRAGEARYAAAIVAGIRSFFHR
ncbi:MAG TPA: N-acetylmuramoyl-L-alanine amidase [Marmoricola sp.]|nr:N-acetylmuramoyl-L-alanine amidase [Marmoricola sp.]